MGLEQSDAIQWDTAIVMENKLSYKKILRVKDLIF
jgi:hypothetical protein